MIRSIVDWLIDPLNHFLLILFISVILRGWHYRKIGNYFLSYAAFWFFLTTISPLPTLLTEHWESDYLVFQPDQPHLLDVDGIYIVVLGGGHTMAPTLPPNDQLSEIALGRVVEGLRIQRLLLGSKLVCSGSSSTGQITQAEALANTALALGLSPQDTILLPTTKNTEDEARTYAARFGQEQPLILVTDAIHMRRAMYWFQYLGCDPYPAPTNHIIKPGPNFSPFSFKPSIRKIEMSKKLLHEYIGLLWGRWRGI